MIKRLLFLLLFFSCGNSFCSGQPFSFYAIRNVSVIPMDKEIILADQTVLVENGLIKSVTASAITKIPPQFTVIDGKGKYLLPGLFDMHAHFFNEQGEYKNTCESELKMMLANGLTTARILAGHPNYLEAKNNVKHNTWSGPDLVVAS